MKVLIYGAGNNAYKLWGDLNTTSPEMKTLFDNAIAFVDSNPQKQGGEYMGLPVISVSDALLNYEDAYYYISVYYTKKVYGEIYNTLIAAGVDRKKILNCRKTCDYLEKFLVCGYHEAAFGGKVGCDIGCHSLKPCCSDYGKNQVDYVPIIENNISLAIETYLNMRKSLLNKLAEEEKCCCTDCKYTYITNQTISSQFSYIIFNEMGRCNCKCIYCNFQDRLGRDTSKDVNLIELYHLLQRNDLLDKDCIVELCNGEITIHPDKEIIYKTLKNSKIMFLTNGLVYDDEITRRMQDGSGLLNVSIDAGTKETYCSVKGIDAFERVVNNLVKYSTNKKGQLYLKYILLPGINDDINDIEGFIELCEKLDVSMAHISYNLCLDFEDYNNTKMINAIKRMVELLKEKKIQYEIYSEGIIEKLLKG